jgi:hypothetical protein
VAAGGIEHGLDAPTPPMNPGVCPLRSSINGVLKHPAVAMAWTTLVVGVHFFGLAGVFRLTRFHALGGVMTVLGIAGFVLAGFGASAPPSGSCPGPSPEPLSSLPSPCRCGSSSPVRRA